MGSHGKESKHGFEAPVVPSAPFGIPPVEGGPMRPFLPCLALLALASPVARGAASAPTTASPRYQLPPKELIDLVDAPAPPVARLDPTRTRLVLMEPRTLPPISEVAAEELRLAGLRVNPRTHGPSRGNAFVRLTLVRIADGVQTTVSGVPPKSPIADVAWAPDGSRLAFTVTEEHGIALWTADAQSGRATRLTEARLNAMFGEGRGFGGGQAGPCRWLPDSSGLVCRFVPSSRGARPQSVETPDGPIIKESTGRKAPARTNPNLLT